MFQNWFFTPILPFDGSSPSIERGFVSWKPIRMSDWSLIGNICKLSEKFPGNRKSSSIPFSSFGLHGGPRKTPFSPSFVWHSFFPCFQGRSMGSGKLALISYYFFSKVISLAGWPYYGREAAKDSACCHDGYIEKVGSQIYRRGRVRIGSRQRTSSFGKRPVSCYDR